jgi:hypothetical protein
MSAKIINGVYTRRVNANQFLYTLCSWTMDDATYQELRAGGTCKKVVYQTPDGVIESNFADWVANESKTFCRSPYPLKRLLHETLWKRVE